MAEVTIKKVQLGSFRLNDFGPETADRCYYIWYDVPGLDMQDHVHTIPAAAIANYRIDGSQTDAMAAIQYYLQEAMTRMQTALTMSTADMQTHPESPLVVQTNALSVVRTQLADTVPTIGASVPGDTPEEVVTGTEEIVTTPPPQVMKMAALKMVPHIQTPTQELSTAQVDYHDTVMQSVAEHPVDTSVSPWTTLTQMVADDTDLINASQQSWFDTRYGREIRFAAAPRFIGTSS